MENSRPQWTILSLLKWAANYFESHDIESPRAAAEILLAFALKMTRIDLYLKYDQPLSSDELAAFKSLIKRRIKREPVAYILGEKEFWSLDFKVNPGVLIPRPETECLVEAALPELEQSSTLSILDLGTGSGAIVIALASEHPRHRYVASDRSPDAVKLAEENARRHQMENRISFCIGEWFEPLEQTKDTFDLIVSNPPYIRAGDIVKLQPEILGYEPRIALDGGEDGLDWIKLIVRSAPLYLRSGGSLIMEIGHDQREEIQKIISDAGGYGEIQFSKDYSGHDRIVRMQKASTSISTANDTAHAQD